MRYARRTFTSPACTNTESPVGPTPSDYTRGYEGGVADAQTALRLHAAAGGPDSAPIFFSVDEDIDVDTWKSLAVEWFRGINSVLGVQPQRYLWPFPGLCLGCRRRRDWALNHSRAPVGMADEGVVSW